MSRKLLSSDRPAARRALQEALYAGAGRDDGRRSALNPRRLASLVASALDETGEDTIVPGGSIDFDAIGEDANATTLAKYPRPAPKASVSDEPSSRIRSPVSSEYPRRSRGGVSRTGPIRPSDASALARSTAADPPSRVRPPQTIQLGAAASTRLRGISTS